MPTAYLLHIITIICIFAIIGLSFNLLAGFTGLTNLGHPGILLLGAYATVLLHTKANMPLVVAWIGGALAGLLGGALLGALTRRARGDAVAAMTLWFGFVIVVIALNWIGLTRGALGIPGIPRPSFFATPERFLILSLGALGIVTWGIARLTRSPFGRVLGAVRDDELGAAALGKNAFKVRMSAFCISGTIAGIAGGLYAFFFRFIDPQSFYLPQLITILTIVYVGGLASIGGTFAGAALVVILPELLRALPFDPEVIGALRQIVFSAMVLGVILARPKGILGKIEI